MKITILGGGISSLATAYYLSRNAALLKSGLKISLITGGRVGGWIQTKRQNGYHLELGPRSLRHNGIAGKNTLELV